MTEYMITSEQIIDKDNDLDIYTVKHATPFNTNEVSIVINHIEELIAGEKIAYGLWLDLSEEEVLDYLEIINRKGELLRKVPLTSNMKYKQLEELIGGVIEEFSSIEQFDKNYKYHEEHNDLDDYIDYIIINEDFDFESMLLSFESLRQLQDMRVIRNNDSLHIYYNDRREI